MIEAALAREKVITIDGPGGAGKSTVARKVAQNLGFAYLDSGAIYRAATWFCLSRSIDLSQHERVLRELKMFELSFEEGPDGLLIFVNSQNVTDLIRSREVTNRVSDLASDPGVREFLRPFQREFARGRSVVAEGRDMGTVIFPDADLKVYLDASLEVRAFRRKRELAASGQDVSLDRVKEEIRQRDAKDKQRTVSPLRVPQGAMILDTSHKSVQQVVDIICRWARERQLA